MKNIVIQFEFMINYQISKLIHLKFRLIQLSFRLVADIVKVF